MNYSDKFGLKNQYFNKDEPIDDLLEYLICNGFENYSAKGISSYFTFRYPVLGLTMFDGINRLDTGNAYIKDKNSKGYVYPYWRPSFSLVDITEAEAAFEVKKLLIKAIEKMVQNKQVIGVTLSGGLDSSLITAMCRVIYPDRKIYTYSCGFYGDDEFEYSRQVAELFSDKHEELILGKDEFIGPNSIVPSLIKHKCAPLHPNETALACAEIKAKQDLCDIVLCGEGADDIFGGYGHNLRMFMTYKSNKGDFFNYIIENYRYFSGHERSSLLQPDFCVSVEDEINIFKESSCPVAIEDKMFYFIQRLHTRGLIERGMNALAYNGFSAGFPFIDDDLVEFVNSLPFDMKVHWKDGGGFGSIENLTYVDISNRFDIPKYILKKIAEEYLPNNIIYRQKKGFPVPFELWFEKDKEWDLDKRVFRTKDISGLSGWKKFMVINLDTFVKIFNKYRGSS